jgi:hypothetical protein
MQAAEEYGRLVVDWVGGGYRRSQLEQPRDRRRLT